MRPTTAETDAKQQRMISGQIAARGVLAPAVLQAMAEVPRDRFVPEEVREDAYDDRPLPIGHRQTISQPYIVGLMTELLRPRAGQRVLEIGTGSGYQAAVLSKLVKEVWSIEVVPELAQSARATLRALGADNVTVVNADGYVGLPALAPFDGILLTAAPKVVPPALLDQLAIGGRMVAPVGDERQELTVYEKEEGGAIRATPVCWVSFVPMVDGDRGHH